MHPMLNIAVRAARAAGTLLARNLGHSDQLIISSKAKDDLVTNIDKECETLIINTLLKSYKDHCVLGEESGYVGNKESDYLWVIDPIDGTTNFIKGIPHVGVSIGLRYKGKAEVAVVFNPILNEMFTAARGEGASLNGKRIRVSNLTSLDGAIVATAAPIRKRERMGAYMTLLAQLLDNVADIRRTGCASLDLCYVACGRFDAYLEQCLKLWDYAAGELIVREAGGIVTDFVGTTNFNKTGNILCGNPSVVKDLFAKVCDPKTMPDILK